MKTIDVYADVSCPFAHAGLARFDALRRERGRREPILRVRAWPLELVNGKPLDGAALAPEIDALRADVAADLFVGFDEQGFPATSLPAMVSEAAAYRAGPETGERFSLAIRRALFEEGRDVSDHDVLSQLREANGVGAPTAADEAAVREDLAEGRRRGVEGSPHFFTADGDFLCPSLSIEKEAGSFDVTFDSDGFERFAAAAFA